MRRSQRWLSPWLKGLVVEHPARVAMLAIGSFFMLAATVRWLIDPSEVGNVGLSVVFGGGFFLAISGGGAAFIEEVVVGNSRVKMKDISPKPTIDSTTVGEQVSKDLEAGKAPTVRESDLDDVVRFFTADIALRGLLQPHAGPLVGCRLHLYLEDAQTHTFGATFEADHDLVWEPFQGVVGHAFMTGQETLAVGRECVDDTYNLTEAQKERSAGINEVAAMPVLDDDGFVIAVLSASNRTDEHVLSTPEGMDELLVRSIAAARIMIDLLKWQGIEADD